MREGPISGTTVPVRDNGTYTGHYIHRAQRFGQVHCDRHFEYALPRRAIYVRRRTGEFRHAFAIPGKGICRPLARRREVEFDIAAFIGAAAEQFKTCVFPKPVRAFRLCNFREMHLVDQPMQRVFYLQTTVFGAINLPSVGSWTLLGMQLRRFLSDPLKLRIFNVTMAVILVATLYPVVFGPGTH